ncbi:3'-5' exonuclease [Bacillus wiedmannii]|uniref:3'-5' exonuclease n=1 Tax=Bacillus TaxID=1386 RepID=UPI001F557903|nr:MULTISPECIES: 3'-5' exonuclease [Bacillus]MCU5501215.1 3'-5' exonuclease [Bacillus wiedmannii]MED2885711.1 3'-5' exonuclease [Bacillus wiedmannii]
MNQLKETKLKIKTSINKMFINRDQFIILNTETTGVILRDQIIEISVIDLTGKTLLIYNAEFDLDMIENTCISNNVEFKNFKSTCIMKMYADYVDSKRWISLSAATELTIKHRAVADCFTVLELLQQLKNNQID